MSGHAHETVVWSGLVWPHSCPLEQKHELLQRYLKKTVKKTIIKTVMNDHTNVTCLSRSARLVGENKGSSFKLDWLPEPQTSMNSSNLTSDVWYDIVTQVILESAGSVDVQWCTHGLQCKSSCGDKPRDTYRYLTFTAARRCLLTYQQEHRLQYRSFMAPE